MSDRRYFTSTKKGETAELKQELSSTDKSKIKDALKKVIAAMTVGKDVSMLFPDVTRNMQTEDLELKKLVYLYLINYAKTQPEMAILAVNTFVKDSMDNNPLLRALAVRTMGCIRVDKITEYLCDPLDNALKDKDPYVRKTAAICVAKLYDMNAELVTERGFLEQLIDLASDEVPMVVSNAVAALHEISEISGTKQLTYTTASVTHFLNALDTCTEWGQVYLLDCLAEYKPDTAEGSENVINRVVSRLQHANSAVVLAAVKVVLAHVTAIEDETKVQGIIRKLAPPLVTLLSGEAEVQYVALRNISLILQRYPAVLTHEVKVFFCKYNDPIFVKLEKLDVMVRLASPANIEQVLAELKEYAHEVDVDFVRKAVHCIGQCAIRLEESAQRCVSYLLELIKMKVSYVVQEAVIVIKDIFRRYPNRYEAIITDLCESLDVLEEPEAKAAMMWIIGEYADRIDNADELLAYFLDSFPDEPAQVQLQLLTATVKLFLKKPTEGPQQMISQVLTCATQETDNPDLRDRAFMYWRLLSNMPQEASKVVLSEKPTIEDTSTNLPDPLLDELLQHLSTLSSVYHKLPQTFVSRQRVAVQKAADLEEKRLASEDGEMAGEGSSAAEGASATIDEASAQAKEGTQEEPEAAAPEPEPPAPVVPDLLGDLLGGDEPAPAPAPPANQLDQVDDLLGGLDISAPAPEPATAPAVASPPAPSQAVPAADAFSLDMLGSPPKAAEPGAAASSLPQLCDASAASGCEIRGRMALESGSPVYQMHFTNHSASPMSNFMIQFNKNLVGLAPVVPVVAMAALQPGASQNVSVPLHSVPEKLDANAASSALQIALKFEPADVTYFQDRISLAHIADMSDRLAAPAFLQQWGALANPVARELPLSLPEPSAVEAALDGICYSLATRPVPGTTLQAMYMACKPANSPHLLLELKYTPNSAAVNVTTKSERPALSSLVFDLLNDRFSA